VQSRGNDLKKQKGKDVNLDIENARASASAPTSVSDDGCEDSERDEENGGPSTLLHESLANDPKKRTKQKTRKHVPEDETPDMRDRRTIFVGNLPLDVLSKKVNQVFSVLEFSEM
jgi:nucleolar protein 12